MIKDELDFIRKKQFPAKDYPPLVTTLEISEKFSEASTAQLDLWKEKMQYKKK